MNYISIWDISYIKVRPKFCFDKKDEGTLDKKHEGTLDKKHEGTYHTRVNYMRNYSKHSKYYSPFILNIIKRILSK